MRLYCLSRTIEVNSGENPVTPSTVITGTGINGGPEIYDWNLMAIEEGLKDCYQYRLTEICIGYDYIEKHSHRKSYFINFYPNNVKKGLILSMTKGAVSLIEVPNMENVFDLTIHSSFLYPKNLGYDLRVRIRCIKNTKTKGRLNKVEEKLYDDYANQITAYCEKIWHPPLSLTTYLEYQEGAFNKLPFFELPNTTKEKHLRQKIKDFKDLVYLLCDPETGSYENMPLPKIIFDPETNQSKALPCRFDQKMSCLLSKKDFSLTAKKSRRTKENNFLDCTSISWIEKSLSSLKLNDYNLEKIQEIYLIKVDLCLSLTSLHPVFTKINFKNVLRLQLSECKITELSDAFFDLLPATLEYLNLEENCITFISKSISKLTGLELLNLNQNETLADVQWKYLSPTIVCLYLKSTNITQIPPEIERFANLKYLEASSDRIQNISWCYISPTIINIVIKGGGKEINKIELENKVNLRILDLNNLKLKEIDLNYPLPKLYALTLRNMQLDYFNTENLSTFLPLLLHLNLKENRLKEIYWEKLSPKLWSLLLGHNEFTSMGDITNSIKLRKFSLKSNKITTIHESIRMFRSSPQPMWDGYAKNLYIHINLSDNQISHLPHGFEDVGNLTTLKLKRNKFHFETNDINETLWKRLPKNMESLHLNQNNLGSIPCYLKEYTIENLIVDDCNLHHICPQLHKKMWLRAPEQLRTIDISNNPELKNLSFIPLYIYQPCYAKEKPLNKLPLKAIDLTTSQQIIGPRYISKIITDEKNENFRNTSKFPTIAKKPIYDFKISQNQAINSNFVCKCCALCGDQTDEELFEQLMIMDFYLKIKKNERPLFYESGKWKTMVKSRFCEKCKKRFIDVSNLVFEEHKKAQDKNAKKQKPENSLSEESVSETEEFSEFAEAAPSRRRKQRPQADDDIARTCNPSSLNVPTQQFHPVEDANSFTDTPPCDVWFPNTYTMPNQSEDLYPTYQEPGVENIILLDSQGNYLTTMPAYDQSLFNPIALPAEGESTETPENIYFSNILPESHY